MIEQTDYLDLPLPHPERSLAEGVQRIRNSFDLLDTKLKAVDETIANSVGSDLDQIRSDIESLKTDVDARVTHAESDATITTPILTEINYNGEQVSIVKETVRGNVRTTLMTYENGRLTQYAITFDGKTVRRRIDYDARGWVTQESIITEG